MADSFRAYFIASANNYEEGLNLILEHIPQFFLEIDPSDKKKQLSLMINELHRYLKVIPKIIVTTSKKDLAQEQSTWGCGLYFKAFTRIDFIKSILKLKNRS
jgi:hypothetical protein